jgi:di/tricarboxylate transporter
MQWVLLGIAVAATVLSGLLQSHEMTHAGEQSVGARGLARLLKTSAMRRYLILSIVCLAISFFAFMALVQAEPLSFAVPASASSFILETWRPSSFLRNTWDASRRRRPHRQGWE